MYNKRSAQRRDTIYYLLVSDAGSGSSLGRVVDLSSNGLLLVSDRRLSMNQATASYVHLPPGAALEPGFPCTLTPRWRRPDRNPAFSLFGCSMALDERYRHIVATLIERYSFYGGEKLAVADVADEG